MTALRPEHFLTEQRGGEDSLGASTVQWISEPGGLTQFGAFMETLTPGARSSLNHWHAHEDELVYVLAGEVTLHEGDATTVLRAGDAATFKAGTVLGHHLENHSTADVRYLVVGTRAGLDVITYPRHDRVMLRDRSQPDDVWTDMAGQPASNPYAD
jgi:uncharacterized cupin superfamily protein